VSWDGAENEICVSCTFGKGTLNPSPDYVTFSFQNGGMNAVRNIHFLDSKFVGGATRDSTDLRPIDTSNWPGYAEYFIDWTVTLVISDQTGKAVPGVDVSVTDALGNAAYQGKTDQEGKVAASLTEFRSFNTPTNVIKELHTPHTVVISKAGCFSESPKFPLQVTETTSYPIKVTCSSN
jgi:hypothetical protein